jgi:hypothetical protein
MAIGLILFAAIVALPVALGAFALGHVTLAGAVLMYVGAGWAVIVAGILSTALAGILGRARQADTAQERAPIRLEVRVVPRN